MRGIPDPTSDTAQNVEWSAVEEGFRLLERDLGKLQVRGSAKCAVSHSSCFLR